MLFSLFKEKKRTSFITLENTSPIQYWREITEKISFFLNQNRISMADSYLVGSGIISHSIIDIEDVDSVIILSDKFTDNELLVVRYVLDRLILNVDILNKYHFRLFDSEGFQNLYTYDGYRLYEFQNDSISFNNTDLLFQSKPILNSDNFNLSHLTQLVYDCLLNQDIFEFKSDSKKAEARLRRNIEIDSINGIIPKANSKSILIDEFFELRNKFNKSQSSWDKFLEKYFKRMKHEYINKYTKYKLNIKNYLCS